jgi:hypothetical protein
MNSLRGFSRQCGISPFVALRPPHHISAFEWTRGFANESRLPAWTGYSRDPAVPTLLRPPFADNVHTVVQDY